jgi:pantothenate kinase
MRGLEHEMSLAKVPFKKFEVHSLINEIKILVYPTSFENSNKHEGVSFILAPIHSFAMHRPVYKTPPNNFILIFDGIYRLQDPRHT